MIPRLLQGTAAIPGGGELKLFRRGEEFSIMLGATELMNSRKSGSEEALATLACAALAGRPAPRVLIGGLGMGFTLRAALHALPAGAAVTVAELVPAVVAWARGPMAHLQQGSLDDPRVTVRDGDVAAFTAEAPGAWDAILLDVDNGPGGITVETNDRLYGPAGLAAARRALRPGGVLAVWSSAPDAAFTARLHRAGFAMEEHIVRGGKGGKGPRHVIWIATAPGRGCSSR
jgi:spermidine synthase